MDLGKDLLDALAAHGDATAVVTAEGSLTYAQLGELADRIATDVARVAPPPGPGTRVAVHSTRSACTIAAYLACLFNEWTYVPIPEDAPESRTRAMIEGTSPAVVVRPESAFDRYSVERVDRVQAPRPSPDLVAVLHTSGSTGAPKAVAISRRNLSAFVAWCSRALPMTPDDRVASLSPFHFDLCTHDIYVTLLHGAAVVLPEPVEEFSPLKCLYFLRRHGITRIYMVPTFLERIASAAVRRDELLPGVDSVLFAGERMTEGARTAVETTFPRARLFNLYGPIETNVISWTEFHRGDPHDSSDIGRPTDGIALRVRESGGALREVGRGELVACGAAVSPGYLDERMTSQKFSREGDGWWYRTGDEVTIADDGSMTLHGRLDNMVKVRGHRIELEDVEAAVGAAPGVRSAGVVVAADGLSTTAYVQVDGDPDECVEAARTSCASRLQPYMVPARFEVVETMPTTATGKVDRRTLKSMESARAGHA